MNHSVLHPTLYTPATTPPEKTLKLINGHSVYPVWRVVLCTEDSIREADVPMALETLSQVLPGMDPGAEVDTFVRVRSPEVLARILELPEAYKLRGFVIPKADPSSFPLYADQLHGTDFRIMPILESPLMTDPAFRVTLRTVFMDVQYHGMIDCLRIGGNDLMGYLGIRRDDCEFSVYDTPVGATIFAIINEFRGAGGFTVTAPVFEAFGTQYNVLLLREVRQHVLNGLFGQTIIHPDHLRLVRDAYKVKPEELKSASGIVNDDTAVNGVHGKMDERATHLKWAELILERYRLFGSTDKSQALVTAFGTDQTGRR
jgi:citrate lyase beta subunit